MELYLLCFQVRSRGGLRGGLSARSPGTLAVHMARGPARSGVQKSREDLGTRSCTSPLRRHNPTVLLSSLRLAALATDTANLPYYSVCSQGKCNTSATSAARAFGLEFALAFPELFQGPPMELW
jgi:hypothetical protein